MPPGETVRDERQPIGLWRCPMSRPRRSPAARSAVRGCLRKPLRKFVQVILFLAIDRVKPWTSNLGLRRRR